MKLLSVILACLVFLGCKKERICDCVMPYQVYYLKATVAATSDLACSMPVLDFTADSTRIRAITGLSNLAYTAVALPSGFVIQNKQLYVEVTTLPESENFPCTTMGLMYPRIKVLDTKPRE